MTTDGLMLPMPRIADPDPDVELAALADLGQKVVNAVMVTRRLGHTDMRHSTRYMRHGGTAAVRLVLAVIDGEIDEASAALERWLAEAGADARATLAIARQTVDPYAPSKRSRSGAR